MEKKHKLILQTSLKYLEQKMIDVERICEYLEVDDILIEKDLAEIKVSQGNYPLNS